MVLIFMLGSFQILISHFQLFCRLLHLEKDVDSVVSFESFRALKLSNSESFRALKLSLFESFRVIKF